MLKQHKPQSIRACSITKNLQTYSLPVKLSGTAEIWRMDYLWRLLGESKALIKVNIFWLPDKAVYLLRFSTFNWVRVWPFWLITKLGWILESFCLFTFSHWHCSCVHYSLELERPKVLRNDQDWPFPLQAGVMPRVPSVCFHCSTVGLLEWDDLLLRKGHTQGFSGWVWTQRRATSMILKMWLVLANGETILK